MSSKIALITGGSRGLGANAAIKLAEAGSDIILTYRSKPEDAQKVVVSIEKVGRKAVALPLDIGKSASFATFADEVKKSLAAKWKCERFDLLVNNAGIGLNTPIGSTTEANFDELVNIHFKGPFFLVQSLLPLINDGGKILNVSTGLTRFSMNGYGVYAACKGAIEVLTRYQALELGARKITVNVLAPGAIETDFGGGAVRDNQQINQYIAKQTALGRVGVPDDIGGAIVSLLSDNMRWLNGERVELSGGIHL